MRKKLEGNGMWESSRMMLPEHKVALNEYDREMKKRQRIDLDEQEWEDISRMVAESMQHRVEISVRMFHITEMLTVVGVVNRVDQLKGRFMIDGEWLLIRDIEGVKVEDV
nr:YolD-like family protein [Paenibacillus sp. PL91]